MLTRSRHNGLLTLIVLCVLVVPLPAEEGDEPRRIDAEDAAAHAGEHVIVTMTVNASRLLRDIHIGFLNSEKDYKSDDNFTVVMYEQVLDKFAEQDIDDPCRHYRGKKIEITGGIELRRGKPQLVLKSPHDIKIVKEDAQARDAE